MIINDIFSIDLDPELPGDGDWKCPIYYYPAECDPTVSYQIIKVTSPTSRWVGYFAPGISGFSAVCPIPESNSVAVVASGKAYLVALDKPEACIALRYDAVKDVRQVRPYGMLLLYDDLSMMALGEVGVKWDTDRLVIDDLQMVEVQNDMVICSGLAAFPEEIGRLRISLEDGKLIDMRLPCQGCGYKTLANHGDYEICPVCFWEDDGLYDDPDEVRGGPNGDLSLTQARINFKKFGAVEERLVQHVRPPNDDER